MGELDSDLYWSIDVPGLDSESAEHLVESASAAGFTAYTVDPREFLTLHMHRDAVETLRSGLSRLPAGDETQPILEILTDWLRAVDAAEM